MLAKAGTMPDSSVMKPPGEPRPQKQSLRRSFRVAWDGLTDAFRSQRNVRIHALATVVVVAAGVLVRFDAIEWCLLVLTIGLVWVAELLNTAIEAAVDLASPQQHELARLAKDVASAAVLLAAVTAVIVGAFLASTRISEGHRHATRPASTHAVD